MVISVLLWEDVMYQSGITGLLRVSLNTKGAQCKCGKSYLDRRTILSGFELLVV